MACRTYTSTLANLEEGLGRVAHHVLLMTWNPWKQAVSAINGVPRFNDLFPLA